METHAGGLHGGRLVQAIVEEYDTTEACARKDVRAFIKQLQEQDLLL